MKSFAILLAILISTCSLSAQLRMNHFGQIEIGKEIKEVTANEKLLSDSTTSMRVIGSADNLGSGGVISFGDQSGLMPYNVGIGEYSDKDTDILMLFGKNGIYLNSIDNKTIASFDVSKGDIFNFNTSISSDRLLVSSENTEIKDIEELDFSLAALKQINPISYNTVSPNSNYTCADSKSQIDKDNFSRFYSDKQVQSTRFGFMPEDIEVLFPELVYTDADGQKYIDYIGLIPVLFKALNDMQIKLDNIENSTIQSAPKKNVSYSAGIENFPIDEYKLFQNSPNPFNTETTITFTLGDNTENAAIRIYDLQGLQKAVYPIAPNGGNAITFDRLSLPAGIYIYSLVANDNIIDSKRMVITD